MKAMRSADEKFEITPDLDPASGELLDISLSFALLDKPSLCLNFTWVEVSSMTSTSLNTFPSMVLNSSQYAALQAAQTMVTIGRKQHRHIFILPSKMGGA
jgi:hypothetical protein